MGSVALRRDTWRGTEAVGVDAVVYGMTPLRDSRKADPAAFGDVSTNTNDQIDLAEPALTGRCCELPEPLAVHVQTDGGRWIEQLYN